MEFVKVPKGTAWLGGGSGQPGTTKVDIEQDFYLGKYEVTQEEWEAVTGQAPSHFSRTGPGADAVKDISDEELKRFPVEFVSWEDCQLFIERLNKKEKDTGRVYRLPKEAEWEHACRGAGDKLDSAFNFTSPSRRIRCCQARLTLNIQKR
jgi:formylglycine-generating enzyme required for sulfatase activity